MYNTTVKESGGEGEGEVAKFKPFVVTLNRSTQYCLPDTYILVC